MPAWKAWYFELRSVIPDVVLAKFGFQRLLASAANVAPVCTRCPKDCLRVAGLTIGCPSFVARVQVAVWHCRPPGVITPAPVTNTSLSRYPGKFGARIWFWLRAIAPVLYGVMTP